MPCLSSFLVVRLLRLLLHFLFHNPRAFSTLKREGRALLPLCPEGAAALTEIGEFCPQ